MDNEKVIEEGLKAEFLLQYPAFQTAFNVVAEEIHNRWYESGIGDTEEREFYWQSLKSLDQVRDKLLDRIIAGKAAERERLNQQTED